MKKKHNHKHLTLSDRIYIEQELLQGSSFTSIARTLRKDPSTISKEIQRHRELIPYAYFTDNCRSCVNFTDCNRKHICGNLHCNYQCCRCRKAKVIQKCAHYITWLCNKPSKPPYVCNSCPHIKACSLDKYLYSAAKAQKNYEKTLSQSRTGINMTPEELQELNDLISPLILKGQPLSHIFAVHADEIPVCRRTLYNYLDQKVFQAINNLTDALGIRTFKKYFPVILTDNGSEFKNPWDIEKTENGTRRTYVFYCDPYVSNQKARLEKNHEYIRYVIPKGHSMHKYTQEDINLLASHINSTARDSLNGACPFDLATLLLDKKIPVLTGQFKVTPDEVMLKPALIEKRSISSKEATHE